MSAGHAKAMLSLDAATDQLRVCNLVVKKGLSVRETENLVKRRAAGGKRVEATRDHSLNDIESQLQQALGTRVRVFHGKKRGRIMIEYYSNEDLNRILDILSSKK